MTVDDLVKGVHVTLLGLPYTVTRRSADGEEIELETFIGNKVCIGKDAAQHLIDTKELELREAEY